MNVEPSRQNRESEIEVGGVYPRTAERKTTGRKAPASERSSKPVLMDPSSPLLHQACANDDVGDVRQQLALGWHVDSPDSFGRSPLHHAALNGSMAAAKVLIEHGARLDIRSLDGRTPFNYAAENLKVEMLQYLSQCAQEKMKTPRIFRGTSPQPQLYNSRGYTPAYTNTHDDSTNNGHPSSSRTSAMSQDITRLSSPPNGYRLQDFQEEGQEMR
eukprot:CAMPEP_0113671272 /NCGR_PEP_ID=MMETSP0038_2-20120614/5614_1 /TAXON_ID=2898 /ORGANISM="Cryptomonas paramecium" /LENGTH=214 /DNA_ID=CAMNT_0000587409 /DNA_START=147 /DNA_END=788 /DNA_ORIENTATION=- /assembly_acc=CAM_ASM_000170